MDSRIPLIGPRKRYLLVNLTPAWCYHQMDTGVAMTGVAPQTATTDEKNTDPEVSGGVAIFADLTAGGLFTHLQERKSPLVVEAVNNPQNATITIVDPVAGTSRAAPTSVPFFTGANEILKAATATTGATVGFLIRAFIPGR
jgi:hypothetical protein